MTKTKPTPQAIRRRSPHRAAMPKRRGKGAVLERGIETEDEKEFVKAINSYKVRNNRPFPSWTEALMIFRSLGYSKREGEVRGEEPAPADVDEMRAAYEARLKAIGALTGKLNEAKCDLNATAAELATVRRERASLLGVCRDVVDLLNDLVDEPSMAGHERFLEVRFVVEKAIADVAPAVETARSRKGGRRGTGPAAIDAVAVDSPGGRS